MVNRNQSSANNFIRHFVTTPAFSLDKSLFTFTVFQEVTGKTHLRIYFKMLAPFKVTMTKFVKSLVLLNKF